MTLRRFATLPILGLVLALILPSTALASGEDLPADLKAELDALPDATLRMERMAKLVEKEPDNALYVFHHANYAFDAQKLQVAAEGYQRTIELDPTLLGAHVNLGSVYDEMGRLDDALGAYQNALDLNPKEDRTLCNIGIIFFKKRQYERAIDFFQQALDANPQSQIAHYNMAILFFDSQMLREAKVEFQKAVDIDPASDWGQRSAENIKILEQLLSGDVPDVGEGR